MNTWEKIFQNLNLQKYLKKDETNSIDSFINVDLSSSVLDGIKGENVDFSQSLMTKMSLIKGELISSDFSKSDIIWIVAPWVWKNVSKKHLSKKKVICSIYHLDFTKFDDKQKKDFYYRDEFVDQYHVISQKTKKDLSELTSKKIISIPFWVNQNIFRKLDNKEEIRKTLDLKIVII